MGVILSRWIWVMAKKPALLFLRLTTGRDRLVALARRATSVLTIESPVMPMSVYRIMAACRSAVTTMEAITITPMRIIATLAAIARWGLSRGRIFLFKMC